MSTSAYAGVPVLVTGGDGFIGSWLARRLLSEGALVVVPRRDVRPRAPSMTARDGPTPVFAHCDVRDHEGLLRLIDAHGIRAVFHLAAQPIVKVANRSPHGTWESNVRGAYGVLEACRVAVAAGHPIERIVIASSDHAYGSHADLPYREHFSLDAVYPYDVSKACADVIARSYAATYDLPIGVTRFANVYGGGDFNWSRIVPDSSRSLLEGRAPVIRSDGSPVRDFIYVEDAVEAYLAIGQSLSLREHWGRAWNAGQDEPVSVLELVRRLIAASGREVEPVVEGRGKPRAEIDRQYPSSEAIRAELGWRPRNDLDSGLARTFFWYEKHLRAADPAAAG